MPPKRGKRKKGKSKKEVTFGPTLAERNINAVKCSLSHFMKVEKHDVVINVPGFSVGLRQEDANDDNYESLQSGEEGEEDEEVKSDAVAAPPASFAAALRASEAAHAVATASFSVIPPSSSFR